MLVDANVSAGGGSWFNYDGTADGAEVEIEAVAVAPDDETGIRSCRLSDTHSVSMWTDANWEVKLCVVDESASADGSAGTVFTALTTASVNTRSYGLSRISDTKFIALMWDGTGTTMYARTYTVSGTTITQDATYTVSSATGDDYGDVVALSSTTALIVYRNNTAGYIQVEDLTIGSGTLTGGTGSNVVADTITQRTRPRLAKTSGTTAALVYTDTSDVNMVTIVTYGSGPTVASGTQIFDNFVAMSGFGTHIATNDAGDFGVVTHSGDDDPTPLKAFDVSGTTITGDDFDSTIRCGRTAPLFDLQFLEEDADGYNWFVGGCRAMSGDEYAAGMAILKYEDKNTLRAMFNSMYGYFTDTGANNNDFGCSACPLTSDLIIFYYLDSLGHPQFRKINKS